MNKKWLVAMILPICLSIQAYAQNKPESLIDRIAKADQKGYDWKTTLWTQDNEPYLRTRLAIDKSIAQGQKPSILERRYKSAVQKDFYDSKSVFRWAYAAYKVARAQRTKETENLLLEVIKVMDGTIKPRVSDWTRLRFLVGIRSWPDVKLIPVGNRLLKRNPKDNELKYEFIDLLNSSSSLTDSRRALAMAQNLVKSDPKKPAYRSALAGAYSNLWQRNYNLADSNRAIQEYRTYLKMAPPNEPFRKDAEFWIQWLLDHRDAKGRYKSHKPRT